MYLTLVTISNCIAITKSIRGSIFLCRYVEISKELDCGVVVEYLHVLLDLYLLAPVEESLCGGGDVQVTREVHTIASYCVVTM